MLKSTMKSAISSVIMSAYVSSQRSSLSLWAAAACRRPPLCDRRALIGLSGRGQLGLYGRHAFGLQGGLGFAGALGGRDEGQQLVGDDPRVVTGLDREDALERHAAQLDLVG